MKRDIIFAVAGFLASLFSLSSFAQESHWKLIGIKTSVMPLAPLIRETKDLPLDLHQQRNVMWSSNVDNKPLKITADVYFEKVPEIIDLINTFINLDFKIIAKGTTPFADHIIYKPSANLETISGYQREDAFRFLEHLVRNNEEKEIGCGVRITNLIPKEDFTVNFKVVVNFGGGHTSGVSTYERDVTYHFFYKWMGSAPDNVPGTVSNCFSTDPTAGVDARDVHYNWAELQTPAILDQNLANKLEMLSQCKSMTDSKVHELFGDISVIVARYGTAECFPDDAGALIHDRAEHLKWASTQTRQQLIKNLHYKLKDGINCLNRTQQNSFFAEISVIMATAAK